MSPGSAFARDLCSLRLVRREPRVSFLPPSSMKHDAAGFLLARKATGGVVFRFALDNPRGQASVPAGSCRFLRHRHQKCLAGSEGKERDTLDERELSAAKTDKGSQRQDVPRAPQPDCALKINRMFDSRRLQYRVFAALQPIANHIHRSADYPVDTPV